MAQHRTSPETTPILQLLSDYSFDVDADAEATVAGWLQRFEPAWVNQAITEALYQGRYKMVSVDHILQFWQRRGQPLRHFNREFESIILGPSFSQIPSPAKVSPAPLNFSQGHGLEAPPNPGDAPPTPPDQGLKHPKRRATAVAHPPQSVAAGAMTAPTAPAVGPSPQPNAVVNPEPSPAPTAGWSSPRSIPPLTPDQLARLAEPEIPALGPIPFLTTLAEDRDREPDPMEPAANPPIAAETPTPVLVGTGAPGSGPSFPQGRIPNFPPVGPRPTGISDLTDSIPPFVPAPRSSDLHQRLKAVVDAGRQEVQPQGPSGPARPVQPDQSSPTRTGVTRR